MIFFYLEILVGVYLQVRIKYQIELINPSLYLGFALREGWRCESSGEEVRGVVVSGGS